MEFIENEKFKIGINEIGGNLTSIIDLSNNQELIHQLDDGGWPVQDVMIFPLIGQYEYNFNNFIYNVPTRHGIIRNKKLSFNKKSNTELVATYVSTEEDLKVYPFKFKLEINYKLKDDKYILMFNVFNLDDKTMYFSIGNHLGIKTNSSTYIDLKNNNKILKLSNGLIDLNESKFVVNKFKLTPDIFAKYDTMVFKNETSEVKLVTLTHRFIYEFNSPLFAIWQNPASNNFVCIEPWWGIASYINEEKDITKRAYINKLDPNESKSFVMSITILKN